MAIGIFFTIDSLKYKDAIKDYCVYNDSKSFEIDCTYREEKGKQAYRAYDTDTCGKGDDALIFENECTNAYTTTNGETCWILDCGGDTKYADVSWSDPSTFTLVAIICFSVMFVCMIPLCLNVFGYFKYWIPYRNETRQRTINIGSNM